MLFTAKVTTVLLAMAASAAAARSAAVPCHGIDGVDITLYEDPKYGGASLSLNDLVEDECTNLPNKWRGRANSIKISGGYCYMYTYDTDCVGPAVYVNADDAYAQPMISLKCGKFYN